MAALGPAAVGQSPTALPLQELLGLSRSPPELHPDEEYARLGVELRPAGAAGSGAPAQGEPPGPWLCLADLGQRALPGDFGVGAGWSSVLQLDLSMNELEVLADCMFDGLGNLRRLGLDHNRIRQVPESLATACPQLESLALHDNDLQGPQPLPASLGNMRELRELRLDRNRNMGVLPSLPGSLQTLHLEGCFKLEVDESLLRDLLALKGLVDVQLPDPGKFHAVDPDPGVVQQMLQGHLASMLKEKQDGVC